MKPIKIIVFLLLTTFSAGLKAQSLSLNKLTVPLSEPGKSYQLNVDLKSDIINLSVYGGKDILIEIASVEKKEKGAGHGMLLIQSGSSKSIIAQEKNNAVSITSASSRRDAVTLNIKIPVGATSIKLSVNNGSISGLDLIGDIEANNLHGNISLTNIAGSVVASSNQGNIKVSFKSVNTAAAMAFSSLTGNIDVEVPANIRANVKLRSDYGNIYSDFEVAPEKTGDNAPQTPSNGVYRFTTDNWVYGKLGGGGQELMIKNYSGNIYLRKTK